MPVIAVGSVTPTKIASTAAKNFLVRNAGANTIFIGDNAGVSAGNYDMTLTANSSLNWGGDREMWGICYNGQESQVEVLYQGNTAVSPAPSTVSVISNKQSLSVLPFQQLDPLASRFFSNPIDLSGFGTIMVHLISNTGDPGTSGPDTINQITLQIEEWDPSVGTGRFDPPGAQQVVCYAYDADSWWIFNPQYFSTVIISAWKFGHSPSTGQFHDVRIEVFGTDKYMPSNFSTVPNTMLGSVPASIIKTRLFPGFFSGMTYLGDWNIFDFRPWNLPSVNGELEYAYYIQYVSTVSPETLDLTFLTFGNSSGGGQYNDYNTVKKIEPLVYNAPANTIQTFIGSGRLINSSNRLFLEFDAYGNASGKIKNGSFVTVNYPHSAMGWPQ